MKKIPIFFDANGSFGNGAKMNPNFTSASELLVHMDRVGIGKSLVWGIAARDYNAGKGNRRLIKDIQSTGAINRLTPAFTISPVLLYEDGAMEELQKEMSSNHVRALRIFPGTLRHTLNQIEPVIEEVEKYKPVLFMDSRDSLNATEFLDLAGKFPAIPMVYMQGMWVNLVTILDLMRRRENILIDSSWLHTPGTIEMIIQKFGVNRILFGAGVKSHNGASLAALQYADISEEDREFVAHKNLEALLGLPESTPEENIFTGKESENNKLWYNLINARNTGLDIIDAHAHLGPSSMAVIEKGEIKKQVDYLLPIMDKMNIKTMIVSGQQALFEEALEGNKFLEESLRLYKGRFLGYLSFNPIYEKELVSHFDDFFSRDFFIGFKLLCDYWTVPLTDSRFEPVWEYCNKHCLPILLHTWEGNYNSPVMLKHIVSRYTQAIFILGHSGGGDKGRGEAEELAIANKNVYLEFCGSFTSSIAYEDTIKKVGNNRVIFGTDAIFHNPIWELGRAFSLNIPDKMLIPIMRDNMLRILLSRK